MRIRVDTGLAAGRNRCQFLLTLPVAIAVGGMYGYELAIAREVEVLLGVMIGAVGLAVFVYVQLVLEPVAVAYFAGDSGRFDEAVAFAWDAVIGTVVGLPLFWFLGVAPLPAMAAAAGAGFAYGYLVGWVVCGDAVEIALGSITGNLGGRPRKPDHSHIQALEARGDYNSAYVEYRKVLDIDPHHVGVAARQARMLSGHMGRASEGVEVLRRCLENGKAPPERWAYALRILTEICTSRLDQPAEALPDLRRLAAAYPDDPAGQWAAMRIQGLLEDDDEMEVGALR